MTNNVIRIKAMRKNWTVDEILEEAELDEETQAQAKEMEKKVHSDETVKRVQNHGRQRQRLSVSPTRGKVDYLCRRCGYDRTHKQCPAIGSLCNACGKRNHYAKVCRSKPVERSLKGRGQRRFEHKGTLREESQRNKEVPEVKNVKHVTHSRNRSPSTESSTSSDNDLVNHLKIHRTGDENNLSCGIYINGYKTIVEPDTGAESNIMDEIQFQALKDKSPELQIHESKVKLNTLKEKLPVTRKVNVW